MTTMWSLLLVICALLQANLVSGVDHCSSNPCIRGLCTSGYFGYTCSCPVDYHEKDCDTFVNHCVSLPCMNGSTCRNTETGFLCQCKTGFIGKTCDKKCSSLPCLHGATCNDTDSGFLCHCPKHYTGNTCEKDCSVLPCLNGGTCNNTGVGAGFHCDCKTGFTGKICEKNCLGQQCKNNGTCINSNTGFTCNCTSGFTGNSCEDCQSQPCKNSAQCINKDDGYSCQCSSGYIGATCTVKLAEKSCNKLLIVTGVAMGVKLADPSARKCTDSEQSKSDVVLIQYCSAPPVTSWIKGLQVTSFCKFIPNYAPIAQFHKTAVTDSTGLFVACLGIDSFQMVVQTCNSNVHVRNVTWPDSLTFHTVDWRN